MTPPPPLLDDNPPWMVIPYLSQSELFWRYLWGPGRSTAMARVRYVRAFSTSGADLYLRRWYGSKDGLLACHPRSEGAVGS